jgi:hypothetical protein
MYIVDLAGIDIHDEKNLIAYLLVQDCDGKILEACNNIPLIAQKKTFGKSSLISSSTFRSAYQYSITWQVFPVLLVRMIAHVCTPVRIKPLVFHQLEGGEPGELLINRVIILQTMTCKQYGSNLKANRFMQCRFAQVQHFVIWEAVHVLDAPKILGFIDRTGNDRLIPVL